MLTINLVKKVSIKNREAVDISGKSKLTVAPRYNKSSYNPVITNNI